MAVQFKILAKSEMLKLPKFSKKWPLYFRITLPQVKLEFGSILMLFFKIQQGMGSMGYVKILNAVLFIFNTKSNLYPTHIDRARHVNFFSIR